MKIKITVYVLMGNDFPCGVHFTKRGIERQIAWLKEVDRVKNLQMGRNYAPGIYYRSYPFTLEW